MPKIPTRNQSSLRGLLNSLLLLSVCGVCLTGCNLPEETIAAFVIPTPSSTAAAGVLPTPAQVGKSSPSVFSSTNQPQGSPEPNQPTQTSLDPPRVNLTPLLPQTGSKPPLDCLDQAAAAHPIDVNIPDDTIMQPGQDFSKTWRLINAGTCTWTEEYAVVWFWGEKMSVADTFPLQKSVAPGEQADVTVNLVAPKKPGTYQSNWKLRNPAGNIFGVGPGDGLYFYVRIIVAGTQVPTTMPGTSNSPNTPTPYAGGFTRFLPNDRIDLDKNQLNPLSGEDIAMNGGEPYYLVPFQGSFLSLYGKNQPTENQCLGTPPSKTPIQVDKLEPGTFLCYLTNEGRTRWIRVQNFWSYQSKAILNVQVYTFPLP